MKARVDIQNKNLTKRSILSCIFSIYDPLGFISPVLLVAKKIFQNLCDRKVNWDDEIPLDIKKSYIKWLNDVSKLNDFQVPRPYNPNCLKYKSVELHYFSDGSQIAYVAVAYIRFIGCNDEKYCSLVLSKTRLIPLNKNLMLTIPRIELSAAKLAVNIHQILKDELDMNIREEYFWIGSEIVLQYIKNESKRFKRFVHNRVNYIRSQTDISQWNYVPGKLNIADIASKGISVNEFLNNKLWSTGPEFLYKDKAQWPEQNKENKLDDENDEIIKSKPVIATIQLQESSTDKLIHLSLIHI